MQASKIQGVPQSMKEDFNLFFLQRNQERKLNLTEQQQVLSIIQNQDLKKSAYLYNPNEVKRKIKKWKRVFPWISPCYAVKSNPSTQILKDLIKGGTGFDCASRGQIQAVLSLGADINKIIYSNSVKDQEDLQWAYKTGVKLTTADTLDQLQKIKKYAPKIGILWRLSINQSQNLYKIGKFVSFSDKFGDNIQTVQEINQRMKQIAQLGINLKGVHFHSGSGQNGSKNFDKAIKISKLCMQTGRLHGHQMSIMNLGGGFPAGQLTQEMIQILKKTQNDRLNYKVYAEPGRHFSSFAFYILTKVIGKRVKNGKDCFHINQSLFHSFNCICMSLGMISLDKHNKFYSSISSKSKQIKEIAKTNQVNIFGMTTNEKDAMAKGIFVPDNLGVYDWICISGMGAYTYGQKSTFSGMQSLTKIIVWPTNTDKKQAQQLVQEKLQIPNYHKNQQITKTLKAEQAF